MARTKAEILEQLLRFLPPRFAAYSDVISGWAAGFETADELWEALAESTTIGGASGTFLTLLARDHGVKRQDGETDAGVRARMRTVNGQVTRPAILEAVNAVLSQYTEEQATMLEKKDGPTLDHSFILGVSRLSDAHNSFVLVVPQVGAAYGGKAVVGGATIGGGPSPLILGIGTSLHPVYPALRALVNRIRAAGVRASIAIDT